MMLELAGPILIILGFALVRIAEMWIHRQNLRALHSAGGEELIPHQMALYYRWVLLIVPLGVGEHLLLERTIGVPWSFIGIGLIIVGLALRFWAIETLGGLWTMRCIFRDGYPRIRQGPYRFLKHPEYTSRLMEGLGFCFFLGSWWMAGVYLAGSALLVRRITRVEARQLFEMTNHLKKRPVEGPGDDAGELKKFSS